MFMICLGLAAIGLALLMFYVGFNAPNNIPLRSYYNLKVKFANGDNLASHAEVRLGGRLVGQALNLRVVNGVPQAQLQLTPSVKPLLSDTTVQVVPRSPIGVKYLNIIPGTHGTRLRNGATIPVAHTTYPVELDQVLDALDPRTRTRTQQLLTQLGEGFLGRGQGLNTAVALSPSLLSNAAAVAGAINDRTGAIDGFIRSTEAAAAAVDPVRQEMASGFDPEARALNPFHQQAAQLERTLSQAPGDLAVIRGGLSQTQPLLGALQSLAVDARPALAPAPVALSRTTAFLRTATPSMAKLRSTIKLAGRAVNPTLGFLHTVQPVLPSADYAMTTSLPILSYLAPRRCDIDMMLSNWASMLGYGNVGGDFLRFDIVPQYQGAINGIGNIQTGIRQDGYPAPCVAGTQ
jgi:ABC-type transporter Mla subunit MlaD